MTHKLVGPLHKSLQVLNTWWDSMHAISPCIHALLASPCMVHRKQGQSNYCFLRGTHEQHQYLLQSYWLVKLNFLCIRYNPSHSQTKRTQLLQKINSRGALTDHCILHIKQQHTINSNHCMLPLVLASSWINEQHSKETRTRQAHSIVNYKQLME